MRYVADLGNARLKLARLDAAGGIAERAVTPTARPTAWAGLLQAFGGFVPGAEWGIASVRPEAAEELARVLAEGGVTPERVRWVRSAAETPVRNRLERPEKAGADRALAVLGGCALEGAERGGVVVMCGTAVTVERIEPGGVWAGGAIAPGFGPMSAALADRAAQLPRIDHESISSPGSGSPLRAWGTETRSALEVGLRGMLIGGCRELVGTMRSSLPSGAFLVWTGGDANWLAPAVVGAGARIEPDLVLRGLAVALGWAR